MPNVFIPNVGTAKRDNEERPRRKQTNLDLPEDLKRAFKAAVQQEGAAGRKADAVRGRGLIRLYLDQTTYLRERYAGGRRVSMGARIPFALSDLAMQPRRYESSGHLHRVLRQLWHEMRVDYIDAGQPFGPSKRALKLWIMYGQFTTCN